MSEIVGLDGQPFITYHRDSRWVGTWGVSFDWTHRLVKVGMLEQRRVHPNGHLASLTTLSGRPLLMIWLPKRGRLRPSFHLDRRS